MRTSLWILCLLLMTGCARSTASAPPAPAPAAAVTPPSAALSKRLERMASSDDRRVQYVAAATLFGWLRAAGQPRLAEALLERLLDRGPDASLRALFLLWYGDIALGEGRLDDAVDRYQAGLNVAAAQAFVGRLLRTELLAQRAVARALAGDALGAEDDLLQAAAMADRVRSLAMVRRAADVAWASGDRARSRRLRIRAEEIDARLTEPDPSLPPLPTVKRPRRPGHTQKVPDLGTLDLRAPWEAGLAQRAGGIGPNPGAWWGYVARLGTRGKRGDPCGRGVTGYYYGRGSHGADWQGGRDKFAVDFTHGKQRGIRFGNASFGAQVRAIAPGIVTHAYFGTRTHWGGWAWGPPPESNRVDVLHLTGGGGQLDDLLSDLDHPWEVSVVSGLQSWSLHLVGLEGPCERGRCVDQPAPVSFGQLVWRGSPLGYEDSTGLSALDHLHFSLMVPCNARDPRCARDDPRLTHVSVPLVLEGQALGDDDVGRCLVSSNTFSLGEGPEAWPAPLDALLPDTGAR